jgi:Na+/serine symporter
MRAAILTTLISLLTATGLYAETQPEEVQGILQTVIAIVVSNPIWAGIASAATALGVGIWKLVIDKRKKAGKK